MKMRAQDGTKNQTGGRAGFLGRRVRSRDRAGAPVTMCSYAEVGHVGAVCGYTEHRSGGVVD